MIRFVSVADARALSGRRGYEPVAMSNAHLILPATVDLQYFGVAVRNRTDWFGKVRLSEAEWTSAFARVLRHPMTKELRPERYSEELYDTEPSGPFGDLIVRQYESRLATASPNPEIRRCVVANGEVIKLDHVLLHASFADPNSRQGYDGYRIKTTREWGQEELGLTWSQLVDLATIWLRDEKIIALYPWAADPGGLTLLEQERYGVVQFEEVQGVRSRESAEETLSLEQRAVYFGRGFLKAIRPYLDDESVRVFVQTICPAAEHLIGSCQRTGGEPPAIPDPGSLIEEHYRLQAEAERLTIEAKRLQIEAARNEQLRTELSTQREQLDSSRAAVVSELEQLFKKLEAEVIGLRAKVYAEAQMLDAEKERLRELLR